MNIDYPCICGHIRQCEATLLRICHPHWNEENNDHKLYACRYCDCKRYVPDNLKYLELLVIKGNKK